MVRLGARVDLGPIVAGGPMVAGGPVAAGGPIVAGEAVAVPGVAVVHRGGIDNWVLDHGILDHDRLLNDDRLLDYGVLDHHGLLNDGVLGYHGLLNDDGLLNDHGLLDDHRVVLHDNWSRGVGDTNVYSSAVVAVMPADEVAQRSTDQGSYRDVPSIARLGLLGRQNQASEEGYCQSRADDAMSRSHDSDSLQLAGRYRLKSVE